MPKHMTTRTAALHVSASTSSAFTNITTSMQFYKNNHFSNNATLPTKITVSSKSMAMTTPTYLPFTAIFSHHPWHLPSISRCNVRILEVQWPITRCPVAHWDKIANFSEDDDHFGPHCGRYSQSFTLAMRRQHIRCRKQEQYDKKEFIWE